MPKGRMYKKVSETLWAQTMGKGLIVFAWALFYTSLWKYINVTWQTSVLMQPQAANKIDVSSIKCYY